MNEDWKEEVCLATNTDSIEILYVLSRSIDPIVRNIVARNTNTTDKILNYLASFDNLQIKLEIVKNYNASDELLNTLINKYHHFPTDDNKFVVINMAKYCKSKEIITLLSKYDDSIRVHIASNLNTPTDILMSLSKDSYKYIRQEVVENPNATAEILESLSKNIDDDIREAISAHPNTPDKVLKEMLNDVDPIKSFALNNLIFRKNLHLLT